MSEAIPPPAWNDILYELEGVRKSQDRVDEFYASAPRAVRMGSPRPAMPHRGLSDHGADLVARCASMNQVRYATLLRNERGFPPQLDHAQLIAPACCILESELDRLVATPALSVVDRLIAALRDSKKNQDQAVTLERWAAGKVPTMLGIITNVLLALRRGIEQGSEPIHEFLEARFPASYLELLKSKSLDRCLNQINPRYRIPACHALKIFDSAAYSEFASLMVANERFRAWDAYGPAPRPVRADAGILYHHLVHSAAPTAEPAALGTLPTPAPDPLARFMGLLTPPASPLKVEIEIEPVTLQRDVAIGPPNRVRTFRLGDRIRIRIQANRSCHLILIDVGTTGRVAVLWPNAWRPDGWIEGGRVYHLPDVEDPEFTYELTGQPGQESIVALASIEPYRAIPLLPEPGAAFRLLGTGEVQRLVEDLNSDPTGWAEARSRFDIE